MKRVTTTQSYVPGVTCPACEDNDLRPEQARNSYSRYAVHYICAACGVREAFEGFFWRRNALKRGIAMTEAGQHEHAKVKA